MHELDKLWRVTLVRYLSGVQHAQRCSQAGNGNQIDSSIVNFRHKESLMPLMRSDGQIQQYGEEQRVGTSIAVTSRSPRQVASIPPAEHDIH